MAIKIWVFLLAFPYLQVARCRSDSRPDMGGPPVEEGDYSFSSDDYPDYYYGAFTTGEGVDTVCIFIKNSARLVTVGEEAELLVGLKNDGNVNVDVVAIKASVHLPFNHQFVVENLTTQGFNSKHVPVSGQGAFPYTFSVSKFLQPGIFVLVGTIFYDMDRFPFESIFFNGTIEVVEPGGFHPMEYIFMNALGISLAALLGIRIHGLIQHLSKKTKRAPKADVGTGKLDPSMDEWLQGTAYTQSLSNKSKKRR